MNARSAFVVALALASILCSGSTSRAQEELYSIELDGWVGSIASDAFGRVFLTGSSDGTLGIWNWASGSNVCKKRILTGRNERGTVPVVAIAPESWIIAVGSNTDVSSMVYQSRKSRQNPGEEAPHSEFHSERLFSSSTHRGPIMSLSFRPNQSVVASGSIDGTIKIWISGTHREAVTLQGHKSWVNSVDFCEIEEFGDKRGSLLASGSSDGTVKLWLADRQSDANTEKNRKLERTLEVTNTEVRCVKFSPVDFLLAAGLRYGDVQLWNAETGERLRSFKAHDGDCWAVRFSPDGQTLITGGGDWGKPGEVKLWDIKTGELKTTLKHSGEVLCLTVSPDAKRLAAGAGDKTVKVWNVAKLLGEK